MMQDANNETFWHAVNSHDLPNCNAPVESIHQVTEPVQHEGNLMNAKAAKHVPSVAVWSYKGGVGKTTLAFHLTDAMASHGYNVALLDLDPQGSTTSLSKANDDAYASGQSKDKGFLFDLYTDDKELGALQANPAQWAQIHAALSSEHDIVVSEYGPGVPGTTLAKRHDLVLVPFQPVRTDYEAALRGIGSLDANVKVIPILTRFKMNSPDHQAFLEFAHANARFRDGVLVMKEASVFQTCNNEGRSVYTLGRRVYGRSEAKAAMDLMAEQVLTALGLPLDKE